MNVWTMRQNKGWSQDKLAEVAGVSHVTVSRLECASRQDGQIMTMLLIANALGANIGDMFYKRMELSAPLRPYIKKKG